MVGSASLTRELLRAGLVDELRIDVMPVMLGGGMRPLEEGELERLPLEKIGVDEVGPRTTLRFRVR
ncbi:MAG: dihydrofolate reductase family protein [Chloroflexi bacterium]|nr:dihydrofolate reductase family protein [Chloroflexota bacterium]